MNKMVFKYKMENIKEMMSEESTKDLQKAYKFVYWCSDPKCRQKYGSDTLDRNLNKKCPLCLDEKNHGRKTK